MENLKIKTDYLHQPWTWVKRIFIFLIIVILINSLPFTNYETVFKLSLFALIAVIFICIPKQEIAVTENFLFIIHASLFPSLNKVRKIKIASIESIRVAGIHNKRNEVLDTFSPGNHGGYQNRIEINFRNGSSESFKLFIYKKDLTKIVDFIRKRI